MHLELCGALLLSWLLLHHTREVFGISMSNVNAWTDSIIVLSWRLATLGDSRPLWVTELHRWLIWSLQNVEDMLLAQRILQIVHL